MRLYEARVNERLMSPGWHLRLLIKIPLRGITGIDSTIMQAIAKPNKIIL